MAAEDTKRVADVARVVQIDAELPLGGVTIELHDVSKTLRRLRAKGSGRARRPVGDRAAGGRGGGAGGCLVDAAKWADT